MIHDGSQPTIHCTAIFGNMDRDYGKLMIGQNRFNPASNAYNTANAFKNAVQPNTKFYAKYSK